MRFWQAITWAETEQLPAIARFAEELGFYGLMGADHALYPQQMQANYPYADSGLPPQQADWQYPDHFVSAAAMAAVTERIKLVCGVYVLPLRHPIDIAKATASLAILSQGRFILGVGSGWMKEEFDIYQVDFKSRGKRMDEMFTVLNKLWQGGMAEHQGEFFNFPKIQLSPKPTHKIPIYTGGAAPIALRRAAKMADGWIGTGNTPEEVPALLNTIDQQRRQLGRQDLPFDAMVGLIAPIEVAIYQKMQETTSMTSAINMPFRYALGESSSLDDKKRFMEKFAEKIIRHFPQEPTL